MEALWFIIGFTVTTDKKGESYVFKFSGGNYNKTRNGNVFKRRGGFNYISLRGYKGEETKMIKITEKADLKRLSSYPKAYKYISKLFEDLICDYSEYCADSPIRAIGAIYYMECLNDFEDYKSLGLEQSLKNTIIEWTNIQKDICVICVVISNDYAINIVCETALYQQYFKGDETNGKSQFA